ncbi:MAG: hypothetical protein NTX91_03670 [candidate division SR1 bacterium]|nr:hypothetical protein [candidate division SR1 bacterium]
MTPDVKIPEGIPTGVNPNLVATSAAPVSAAPAVPTEGTLDRIVKSLTRFFAKLLGKPDPITGQPLTTAPTTPATPAATAGNFVDKMWSAANKAVDTATTVATKAVDTANTVTAKAVEVTTSTVNQAVEGVKDVKADIEATTPVAPTTPAPAATQPLETLEKTQ